MLPIDAIEPDARRLTDRYEFQRELGRGGMSVVYLAREVATGRLVAVKLLKGAADGDDEMGRRFEREARTVASLEHPSILRVLHVEALDGRPAAIVSEYVSGESLRETLRREGRLPFERATALLREIASALAHAHERRIVHRDVKPDNILIEEHTGRVLLADFGVARLIDVDTQLTAVGSAIGTPSYMAPEQVDGRLVDARADVYALGLVGWEMLAGQRPWEGETLYGVLHKQQHERLPALDALRPDIPTFLLRAIEGAIEKDPDCRWRDGGELLERLTPVASTLPKPRAVAFEDASIDDDTLSVARAATATPSPSAAPAPVTASTRSSGPEHRRHGRRRRGAWVGGAVALLLVVIAAFALTSRRDPRAVIAADPALDSLLVAATAGAPPAQDVEPIPVPAPRATVRETAGGGVDLAAPPPLSRPTTVRPGRSRATPPPSAPPPSAPQRATSPRATPQRTTPPRATPQRVPARVPAPTAPTVPRVPTGSATYGDARCDSAANDDQEACLLAAIARNDVALNRTYRALIAEVRLRGGARAEEALRAEQRAWVSERDRVCRLSAPAGPGSRWGAARVPCFADRTAARAATLRERLAR